MARAKLEENATIAEIIGSLDKPTDYVRCVFGNMCDYKKIHGSAYVRIGITGRGIVPHYRIEPDDERLSFLTDFLEGGDVERHFVAFNGRNHNRLDWGSLELRGSHWSGKYMNIDAVQSLLGVLRGYKRKPDAHRT